MRSSRLLLLSTLLLCTSAAPTLESLTLSTITHQETTPEPSPFMTGGLTLDKCRFDEDCLGGRLCQDDLKNTTCSGISLCVCVPSATPPNCREDNDCEAGEKCKPDALIDQEGQVCVSEQADSDVIPPPAQPPAVVETMMPSPTPADGDGGDGDGEEEDAVCVDAKLLAHLSGEELVFERHAWARVLCDGGGSCATQGHIVVWGGKVMMMRSYCEVVGGCVEKRILVNSPRYRRGIRVASLSEGLEFTAFAARWGTRVEEVVLRGAVRVGL